MASSTIIQSLSDSSNDIAQPAYSIAFFYCTFTDSEKQKTRNLICSLLVQLAQVMPQIPNDLSHLYNQYKNVQPPIENMKKVLRSVLELSGQSFIIIDALDECIRDEGGRTEILTLVTELSRWALPNVHILVTSRNEPDIEKALVPLVTVTPVCIQSEKIKNDIGLYVRSHLTADPDLKKWHPTIKKEIEEALVNGAHGMYELSYWRLSFIKSRC